MTDSPTTRMRIGVLGGTFNPIHLGHLILAQTALETHDLAKVLFNPCARPPHKDATGLIAPEHRLAMVDAAIEGDWRLESSDIEIRRGGVSYAIDTVRELSVLNPDADLSFILGADELATLHQWKDIHDLLPLCAFVSFSRPGYDPARFDDKSLGLPPPWPGRLRRHVTQSRMIDISSSDIRYRVAEGLSIRYLVPQAAEMYIAEHALYTK